MKYDYLAALEYDIKEWCRYEYFNLSEYEDIEDAHEFLHDELWDDDSITGNGGNWYASTAECEEYLSGNWNLIFNAIENFCVDMNEEIKKYKEDTPCFLDCLVRLDLLDKAIGNVLEDLVNNASSKW